MIVLGRSIETFLKECEEHIAKINATEDDGLYAGLYVKHVGNLINLVRGVIRINPEIKPDIRHNAGDAVNPQHYHGDKVMVFIEEFNLGFCEGNAVKYIARHQEKGTPLQDLKKAMWYLERAISNLETERVK